MPITSKDRAAVRHIYAKVVKEIGPALASAYANAPADEPKVNPVVVICEQTLFKCLEVVLHESMPFEVDLLPELATRMAAYILSAGPQELHEKMAKSVSDELASAVRRKVERGYVVKTSWNSDGIVHPNIMTRN